MLADALRTGDPRTAGEGLDSELDAVVEGAKGCGRTACGCVLAYILPCLPGGVFNMTCEAVGRLLGHR